jgi:hypothetical protein
LEYFTREELAEMKTIVIKMHLQQRKFSTVVPPPPESTTPTPNVCPKKTNEKSTTELREDPDYSGSISSLNQLPNELLLKIFSQLSYQDKLNSARVCKKWNSLVYDRVNWRKLNFSDWKSSIHLFWFV